MVNTALMSRTGWAGIGRVLPTLILAATTAVLKVPVSPFRSVLTMILSGPAPVETRLLWNVHTTAPDAVTVISPKFSLADPGTLNVLKGPTTPRPVTDAPMFWMLMPPLELLTAKVCQIMPPPTAISGWSKQGVSFSFLNDLPPSVLI